MKTNSQQPLPLPPSALLKVNYNFDNERTEPETNWYDETQNFISDEDAKSLAKYFASKT